MKTNLTKKDGEILLKLARESIEEKFTGKKLDILKERKFKEKRGVFVTLTKAGGLRGCIGFPYPVLPIEEAVIQAAKSAAFSDSRFAPIQENELNKIKIEISVLTAPEKITEKGKGILKKIKAGKDGLIIKKGNNSGLLLPQVAVEHKMSEEQFLDAVCQKAGLAKDMWKKDKENLNLLKFQVQIFREKDL